MNTSVSDVKYDFIILENFKPLRMAALFNLIPKQLMQCFVKLLELKPKAILTSTFLNLFYFILIFYSFFFFLYKTHCGGVQKLCLCSKTYGPNCIHCTKLTLCIIYTRIYLYIFKLKMHK